MHQEGNDNASSNSGCRGALQRNQGLHNENAVGLTTLEAATSKNYFEKFSITSSEYMLDNKGLAVYL